MQNAQAEIAGQMLGLTALLLLALIAMQRMLSYIVVRYAAIAETLGTALVRFSTGSLGREPATRVPVATPAVGTDFEQIDRRLELLRDKGNPCFYWPRSRTVQSRNEPRRWKPIKSGCGPSSIRLWIASLSSIPVAYSNRSTQLP